MGIWKPFSILLLSLTLFAVPSNAGNTRPVLANVQSSHFFSQKFHFAGKPLKAIPLSTDIEYSLPDFFSFEIEELLVTKMYKIKKKYKRVVPGSSMLRQPVREVDIIPLNIYIKETYSKPFFVSPLHRFLFRLTPF
ncbi:MAG: hypothetical protein EOO14_23045 [Chitinophagaceae bacterium]|nr:MAG: hypothetical protein EOO14_23045 [Chitinophagaceae bacterium]